MVNAHILCFPLVNGHQLGPLSPFQPVADHLVSDEPRRSGRATKGQHTKDRDIADEAPKKKAKGSKAKVKAEAETGAADDDSVEAEGEREGEFLPGYAR